MFNHAITLPTFSGVLQAVNKARAWQALPGQLEF